MIRTDADLVESIEDLNDKTRQFGGGLTATERFLKQQIDVRQRRGAEPGEKRGYPIDVIGKKFRDCRIDVIGKEFRDCRGKKLRLNPGDGRDKRKYLQTMLEKMITSDNATGIVTGAAAMSSVVRELHQISALHTSAKSEAAKAEHLGSMIERTKPVDDPLLAELPFVLRHI